MDLQPIFEELDQDLKTLVDSQEYEQAVKVRDFRKIIEEGDKVSFMKCCFDLKELKSVGFFKKEMNHLQMVARMEKFMGYESIFEYAIKKDGHGIICNTDGTATLTSQLPKLWEYL